MWEKCLTNEKSDKKCQTEKKMITRNRTNHVICVEHETRFKETPGSNTRASKKTYTQELHIQVSGTHVIYTQTVSCDDVYKEFHVWKHDSGYAYKINKS